jgi:VWFA-related protein
MNLRALFRFILVGCLVLGLSIPALPTLAQEGSHLTVNTVDDSKYPALTAYLTATDATGLPIDNLKPESFSVSEDEQPVKGITVKAIDNSDQPINVVLAIDTSGSMAGKPISDTQQAAKSFIGALSPTDQVGLVTFAAKASEAAGLSNDKAPAASAIDQLKAGGGTAMFDAIVTSVGALKSLPAGRKAIVLLTDGEDMNSTYKFDEAINEAARHSIPIYPIGFGNVNRATLEKIAQLTGGYAQIKPASTELQQAFDKVRQVLRQQYSVEWASQFPADGKEHTATIVLAREGAQIQDTHTFVARPGQVTVGSIGITDGQTIGGDVKLTPNVNAPASTSSVEYQLDGAPLTKAVDEPFSYTWDSTAVSEGEHTLTAIATDAVGNVGKADVKVTVRPPLKIQWDSPVNGGQVTGPGKIRAAVDSLAGVAKVEYFVDGKLIDTATSAPYDVNWSLEGIQPGQHILRVLATDVNNKTAEASVGVTVSLRDNTLIFVLALAVVVVAALLIIPVARRRRAKLSTAAVAPIAAAAPAAGAVQAASLLEVEGMQPGQMWPLNTPEVHIGRKRSDNDIAAAGRSASRRHADIRLIDGQYILFNLNPDNVTLVNGSPVSGQYALQPGDEIRIGESVFRFQTGS